MLDFNGRFYQLGCACVVSEFYVANSDGDWMQGNVVSVVAIIYQWTLTFEERLPYLYLGNTNYQLLNLCVDNMTYCNIHAALQCINSSHQN